MNAPAPGELMPSASFAKSEMARSHLKLPNQPKARLQKIESLLDEFGQGIEDSLSRYETLRTLGPKALSDYDINIASGGDAGAALRMALRLVGNHVRYFRGNMELLKAEQRAVETELCGGAEQLALL